MKFACLFQLVFTPGPYTLNPVNYTSPNLYTYPSTELRKFLVFVTSQSVVPDEIIFRCTGSRESLPVAHTCFSRLDLPDYLTAETLQERLSYCLDNAGFGIA
jgi:hypothetical protein